MVLADQPSTGSHEHTYRIKRIEFLGRHNVPIFLQNLNGPCPLLSIANVLSLRNQLGQDVVGPHATEMSTERLLAVVADRILNADVGGSQHEANLRANIHDCLEVLNKLGTGVDVNVRFSSPTGFEFTNEIAIFDLLGISLVHGWLVDPQAAETFRVLGNKTYNQAVEMLIAGFDPDQGKQQPSGQAPPAAHLPAPSAPTRATAPAAAGAAAGADEVDLLGLGVGLPPAPSLKPSVSARSANQDIIDALDSLMDGLASAPSVPTPAAAGVQEATPAAAAGAVTEVAREAAGAPAVEVTHTSEEPAADAGAEGESPDAAAAVVGQPLAERPVAEENAGAHLEGSAPNTCSKEQGSAATAAPPEATAPPAAAAAAIVAPVLVAAAPAAAAMTAGPTLGPDDLQLFAGLDIAAAAPSAAAANAPAPTLPLAPAPAASAPAPMQPHSMEQPWGTLAAAPHPAASAPVAATAGAEQASAPAGPGSTSLLASVGSHTRRTHEALVVKEFLDGSASQLTVYGITQIAAALNEHALAVFFRNNHFNCLFKHGKSLYLLVTDQGYLSVPEVTWERLDTVDGDTQLCGPDFKPHKAPARQSPQATHINMEALAAIPPEALQGMSEADAAAIAEAAGLLTPVPAAPTEQHGSSGAAQSQRTSQQGGFGYQPPQQHLYGDHGAAGRTHSEDADLALALQLQQQEEEEAARHAARMQQQQQHQQQQQQHQQQQQQQQPAAFGQGAAGSRQGRPAGPQAPSRAPAQARPAIATAPPASQKEESSCTIM